MHIDRLERYNEIDIKKGRGMKRLFFTTFFLVSSLAAEQPWARTYKHVFSNQQMKNNRKKDELIINETNTLPFTQLIFSWNAFRPSRGRLNFYVRVRDQKLKTWGQWHKMIEWGSDIQKSYFSRGRHAVFTYARLEMNNNQKGDAYQIKALTKGKASLGAVKGLMITASDFKRFQIEPYKDRGKGLTSHFVKNVPKKSQIMIDHPRCDALCSPTSMSMVVEALGGKKVKPLEFANYVYDEGLDVFGNWGFNMAHAFEHIDTDTLFYTTRLSSFQDLHDLLKQDIPVAVSVRGKIKGAKKEYKNGHLLVVVGFDAKNKKVICYDPAFDTVAEVEKTYDMHDFIVAWERSRRLTYKPEVAV